jgi:hypothetical protein
MGAGCPDIPTSVNILAPYLGKGYSIQQLIISMHLTKVRGGEKSASEFSLGGCGQPPLPAQTKHAGRRWGQRRKVDRGCFSGCIRGATSAATSTSEQLRLQLRGCNFGIGQLLNIIIFLYILLFFIIYIFYYFYIIYHLIFYLLIRVVS